MNGKQDDKAGLTQVEYESQRRAVALSILKNCDRFIDWDVNTFNPIISALAQELLKAVRENPRVLESSPSDAQELLKELAAKRGRAPDIAGADILGANVWDDIWGVIKELLTGEKDFIKEIIKHFLGMK